MLRVSAKTRPKEKRIHDTTQDSEQIRKMRANGEKGRSSFFSSSRVPFLSVSVSVKRLYVCVCVSIFPSQKESLHSLRDLFESLNVCAVFFFVSPFPLAAVVVVSLPTSCAVAVWEEAEEGEE